MMHIIARYVENGWRNAVLISNANFAKIDLGKKKDDNLKGE